MASSIQNVKIADFAACVSAAAQQRATGYEAVYEANRRRIYSLAFWMTDHEMAAEDLMADVFRRAFAHTSSPDAQAVDRAFVSELRELMPLGALTLRCQPSPSVLGVRRNTLRVHLERAVVQVPPTERMIFLLHDVEGYDHERVARTLGISQEDAIEGLHQARLRIRELVSTMSA